MAAQEFTTPVFLEGQSVETIHARMMTNLPADIDNTQGGWPWDLTRPTALELAEILQFQLVETLKLMFPAWSYGRWLDYHAASVGLTRKAANHAAGTLTVTGTAGTEIPIGFRFAAPSVGSSPAIEFRTVQNYVIGATASVAVEVEAVSGGTVGNVAAGTVRVMVEPIDEITSISHASAMSGGAEEEDDESLRERIANVDAMAEASFVGCPSDYIRWAQSISGVGTVLVTPVWNGAGTVKLTIMDANGQPANATILAEVYNYIVSPDDATKQLAPIGAVVTIVAPTANTINYAVTATLTSEQTAAGMEAALAAKLEEYYIEAKNAGVLRYTRVAALLSEIPGVTDFSGLTLNGSSSNISLDDDEYPVTGTITATTT